jgi:predicted dehydrogenase
MSLFHRIKEGKVAPALQNKLSQLSTSNGHANHANGAAKDISNGQTVLARLPDTPTVALEAPRIVIIGAGSRGSAYARAIKDLGLGLVVGVCEPVDFVRKAFGAKYIWGPENREAESHEEFKSWTDYLQYEQDRRRKVTAQELKRTDHDFHGADAAFICVLDEMHIHAIKALAPLGLHVMCEKPLATTLQDCIGIYGSVVKEWETLGMKTIFSICHVLRYSPHNMLLHKIVREDRVIGDVIAIEHTEPVGWWHFTHSYVRGNWRRSDTSAPSLLTKSCHDIDFLLWMLCSPAPGTAEPPHLPSTFASSGTLNQFRKARKPIAAGDATNCLDCPIGDTCNHSAKNIYLEKHFEKKDLGWPVKIVVPEIEDIYQSKGKDAARSRLLEELGRDYDADTPDEVIKRRNWYGRCVWESDNTVCDDQTVTISWDDDPLPRNAEGVLDGTTRGGDVGGLNGRGAKSAVFHMIAPTKQICERRGRIYGTTGEIFYNSSTIEVHDFTTDKTTAHQPSRQAGGHGGGDDGLATNFMRAVMAVKNGELEAQAAQRKHLGCSLDEVVRSHVAVFAAEKARTDGKLVDWKDFWANEVEQHIGSSIKV